VNTSNLGDGRLAASGDRVTDERSREGASPPSGSVPTGAILLEIIGHLGAARTQRLPSDDQIIAEHIRAAYDLAVLLRRAA
jgi:hypothetical protein